MRNFLIACIWIFIIGYWVHASSDDYQLKIPRQCLTDVKLMPDTECIGSDMKHLSCQPLNMTYLKDCVEIVVHQGEHDGKAK